MDRFEYLQKISDQIRCRQAVSQVTEELESHIEEQKRAFLESGMKEEEAESRAVLEMGDPVEVGVEMDRIHRPKMNWRMIGGIGLLSMVGYLFLILLNDIGADEAGSMLISPVKYGAFVIAGFLLMIGICYIDYTRIMKWARSITVGGVAILVTVLSLDFFHILINGEARYIGIFGITVNIGNVLFLFAPLYGGIVYQYRNQKKLVLLKCVLWMLPGICVGVRCGIVDTILYILICMSILTTAIVKNILKLNVKASLIKIWGGFCGMTCLYFFYLWNKGGYHQARLKAIWESWTNTDPFGRDYQAVLIREYLAGCKWFGKSSGVAEIPQGIPGKMSFPLTYMISYLGIMVTWMFVIAIAVLYTKLLLCVIRQKNRLGMLAGVGCVTVLCVQSLFSGLVNLGVYIGGNIYFPFITYGKGALCVTYILLGIILSIYRYQNIASEPKSKRLLLKYNE